ncbi:MAG: carbohydrate ABC transporter permease [Acholeplasmatales bacterium]|nr:carbohydrate ABC transporter permease [Acholeplasmatales bacterium]
MAKQMDYVGAKENNAARAKLIVQRTLVYTFMILLTVICLFFFYLLFVNATRSHAELQAGFTMLPSSHFFENLDKLWNSTAIADVKKGILNSFIIASLSALLTTYFSALCAYGIYAYDFKGRRIAEVFILAIMMIPSQVSSVGFVQMCNTMGWKNQFWILIVPGIAAPATFFYMIQHLRATLPLELVEASRMDGSSEFMTFNRIVLPVMKPALAVQLIFSFVASWNNLYLPTLLLTDKDKRTLPTMLSLLRSADFSKMDMGLIYAAIFVSIFPVLVVYLFLSKSIIKGVTSGSVKG